MPSTTFVSPDLRLGMARVSGNVTGAEIANASIALYGDTDWRPGFDEIWDLSTIREFDMTPDQMDSIVQFEQDMIHHVGTGRVVLVVTRDVVEMLGSLYRRLVADLGRSVEVVRALDEGAAWLGLDAVPAWLGEPPEVDKARGLQLSRAKRSPPEPLGTDRLAPDEPGAE